MSANRVTVWISAAGLLVMGAVMDQARGIGLQVADTADVRPTGEWTFSAGMVYSDEEAFYGVREAYALFDSLQIFVDAGVVDYENDSADLGGQGGALWTLPVDFITDLAARAVLYGVNADNHDVFGGNALLLSSGETRLDGLYVYAGAGIDVADWETREGPHRSTQETRFNPLVTGGILFNANGSLSIYAEASYTEEFQLGAGLRIR